MPSQNDFRIMQILRPLWTLTRQPSEEALALYCDKLTKFSFETIQHAVNELIETWDKSTPPPIAILLQICRTDEAGFLHVGEGHSHDSSWQEREMNRKKMMSDYFHQLVKSPPYQQADVEGWEHHLRHWCMEACWVQAQRAHPAPNGSISFCAAILKKTSKEILCQSFGMEPPQELVNEWKRLTALEQERERNKQSPNRDRNIPMRCYGSWMGGVMPQEYAIDS